MRDNKKVKASPPKEKNIDIQNDGAKKAGRIALRVLSYVVNIFLTILLIGMICGIIIGTAFAVYIKNDLDLEIDSSMLVSAAQDKTTRIYYMKYDSMEDRQIRNGTPIELEDERLYGSVNSLWAEYSSMPKQLTDAFISIEDHRFMTHNGVDWLGTAKAFVNYFVGFEQIRGASTITQQLVKNLTGDDDVTIQRKVEEIFRALNLEKQLSKEEILEMYLNIAYFGNNCYGVRTAASTYFGKEVSELNLVECAALAGIVKNPSRYEPLYHDEFTYIDSDGNEQTDGNKVRRGTVLYAMREYGCISEAEYEEALEQELNITYFDEIEEEEETNDGLTIHSWYVDSVITKLIDDLMEKYGWTRAVASTKLYTSGYSIYIPMDPEVQDVLEDVYENDDEYFPKAGGGLQPESAMVITDPYTGDVLGLVGGRGEKNANLILNRATGAVRPVGSSIKPIAVYAPAMDAGLITPTSIELDGPVMYNEVVHGAGTSWQWTEKVGYPKNYPEGYHGNMTITTAVTNSVNTVAMKTLQKLTIDKSFDFMKNTLHIDNLIDRRELSDGSVITDRGLAALSLGQLNYGITVMEMAGAYTMFPNNGLFESPNLYLYVEDSQGNIVLENTHYTEVAVSENTAKTMTAIMKNVMSNGTGVASKLRHTVDVAGKTGTTNADFDRYFVGYTPYYIGATWTGYDINSSLQSFRENPSLLVWDTVMTRLHQKYIDAANAGGEELRHFDLDGAQSIWSYTPSSSDEGAEE